MLAGPLIATIFGYGAFTDRDVLMCGYALMAYSLGLVGFSMVKVLAPGFFARQDTRTPVKIGIIALAINMGFNVCVVVPAFLNGFAGAARAARRFDRAFRPDQRNACSIAACAGRVSTIRRRPGAGSCRRSASRASRWLSSCGGSRATGRPGPTGRRFAVPPGSGFRSWAAALVYFGVLALAGARPRDLKHL